MSFFTLAFFGSNILISSFMTLGVVSVNIIFSFSALIFSFILRMLQFVSYILITSCIISVWVMFLTFGANGSISKMF